MSECPHGLFDVCCTNYERCTLCAPKKEWVGLTDDERKQIIIDCEQTGYWGWEIDACKKIEAKLKEKNT